MSNTSGSHTCAAFPTQGGMFVTRDTPTFLHCDHPNFTVTLNRFALGVTWSMGLDNCSMVCMYPSFWRLELFKNVNYTSLFPFSNFFFLCIRAEKEDRITGQLVCRLLKASIIGIGEKI